jgi:hypothetical protein
VSEIKTCASPCLIVEAGAGSLARQIQEESHGNTQKNRARVLFDAIDELNLHANRLLVFKSQICSTGSCDSWSPHALQP